MIPWRGREPAAETKKAGNASEDNLSYHLEFEAPIGSICCLEENSLRFCIQLI